LKKPSVRHLSARDTSRFGNLGDHVDDAAVAVAT
jgi:hypothetical protein